MSADQRSLAGSGTTHSEINAALLQKLEKSYLKKPFVKPSFSMMLELTQPEAKPLEKKPVPDVDERFEYLRRSAIEIIQFCALEVKQRLQSAKTLKQPPESVEKQINIALNKLEKEITLLFDSY